LNPDLEKKNQNFSSDKYLKATELLKENKLPHKKSDSQEF
jgi:hypothetical protein